MQFVFHPSAIQYMKVACLPKYLNLLFYEQIWTYLGYLHVGLHGEPNKGIQSIQILYGLNTLVWLTM